MALPKGVRFVPILMLLLTLNNPFAFARKPADATAIKAKIESRGVGHRVRVVLADKTEEKGTIVIIGADSVSIQPIGAAQPVDISYKQITSVHRDKVSTGPKLGMAVGVGLGIAAIVAIAIVI